MRTQSKKESQCLHGCLLYWEGKILASKNCDRCLKEKTEKKQYLEKFRKLFKTKTQVFPILHNPMKNQNINKKGI